MLESILIPEPWLSFLEEIEMSLTEPTEFHCLGGFVIAHLYGFQRTTADIDVMSISPRSAVGSLIDFAGYGTFLHKKYRVYLDVVGIATVPENYELRLTAMSPGTFKNLHLFALDPYDIALAKIERNIQRDRDDVKHLARIVPFDLEVLKSRYEQELRVFLGNPTREDLALKLWIEAIQEERGFESP